MGGESEEQQAKRKRQQRVLDMQAEFAAQENLDNRREQRMNRLIEKSRERREQALARGRERGEEIFGAGKLGRLREGSSTATTDILRRRRENLGGFTPEELNAKRDRVTGGIDTGAQTALRQLRGIQGANNLRGATAAAQNRAVLLDSLRKKAETDRDLFIENANQRRKALDQFEGSTARAEADEDARSKFNLAQTNKEKLGQLSTEFGFANLDSSDRNAIATRVFGEEASAARDRAIEEQGKK